MKRSTAISRLSDIADEMDRVAQWPEVTLVGGYVFGGILEPVAEMVGGSVVVVAAAWGVAFDLVAPAGATEAKSPPTTRAAKGKRCRRIT